MSIKLRKINVSKLLSKTEKTFTDNSPLILTAFGVVGIISTAYLTGKATIKAVKILEEVNDERIENIPFVKDDIKLLWKCYIPPVVMASLSVAAVIGSNRIGNRRTAAMAAAYSISERAFTEYKDKVVEKIGENKERAVRDEIAQERVAKHPPIDREIILTGKDETLCLDSFSGRYFMSDMQSLRSAQNSINEQVLHSDYATVTDYYNLVGLEDTTVSGEMGWNTDKLLELHYSATMVEDGTKACMVVDFATVPVREPWRFC